MARAFMELLNALLFLELKKGTKMEEKKNQNEDYTILQASQFFHMTTKTIYNYVKKGILKGYKWNGMWLIENESIVELNMKLNRTKIELKHPQNEPDRGHEKSFWVEKSHYEELLRQAGQLRAAENLLIEYKAQNQQLLEQVKSLEKEVDRVRQKGQNRGFLGRLRRRKESPRSERLQGPE